MPNYPVYVDLIEIDELVRDIDFLEIDTIRKIELWNVNSFKDKELENQIATFWMAETGIASMEAYEDVIRQYHMLLKE